MCSGSICIHLYKAFSWRGQPWVRFNIIIQGFGLNIIRFCRRHPPYYTVFIYYISQWRSHTPIEAIWSVGDVWVLLKLLFCYRNMKGRQGWDAPLYMNSADFVRDVQAYFEKQSFDQDKHFFLFLMGFFESIFKCWFVFCQDKQWHWFHCQTRNTLVSSNRTSSVGCCIDRKLTHILQLCDYKIKAHQVQSYTLYQSDSLLSHRCWKKLCLWSWKPVW